MKIQERSQLTVGMVIKWKHSCSNVEELYVILDNDEDRLLVYSFFDFSNRIFEWSRESCDDIRLLSPPEVLAQIERTVLANVLSRTKYACQKRLKVAEEEYATAKDEFERFNRAESLFLKEIDKPAK